MLVDSCYVAHRCYYHSLVIITKLLNFLYIIKEDILGLFKKPERIARRAHIIPSLNILQSIFPAHNFPNIHRFLIAVLRLLKITNLIIGQTQLMVLVGNDLIVLAVLFCADLY